MTTVKPPKLGDTFNLVVHCMTDRDRGYYQERKGVYTLLRKGRGFWYFHCYESAGHDLEVRKEQAIKAIQSGDTLTV